MIITDFLKHGKENITTTRELCELSGLSQRQVCKEVERARKAGAVILSSASGGYWLPALTDSDIEQQLERFIKFMLSKNTFPTVKGAQNLLATIRNGDQLKFNL